MAEQREGFEKLSKELEAEVERMVKQLLGPENSASTMENIKTVLSAMGVPVSDVEQEGCEVLVGKALQAVTEGELSTEAAVEEIFGSSRGVIEAVVAENVALKQKHAFIESLRSASYRKGTV